MFHPHSRALLRFFIPSRFCFSSKVFVKNVPDSWSGDKLKQYFSKAGEIESVSIINNQMG